MVNCCTTDMGVDGVDGQMRFWRNTRVANLSSGQSTTLGDRDPRLRVGRDRLTTASGRRV